MAGGDVRLTIKFDPDKEGEHFRVTSEAAQKILGCHLLGSRVTVSTQVTITSPAQIRDEPPPAEPEALSAPLCGQQAHPNDGAPCVLDRDHDGNHEDADELQWVP
jgi:hypothetical protein